VSGGPAGVQSGRRLRLLVLCPYPVGVAPGQRLKYEQYFDYFERCGIAVTVSPFMSRRLWTVLYRRGFFLEKVFWTLAGYVRRIIDLGRAPFFDGTYVFLWGTPFGPPIFEWLLSKLQPRLVYDIDDMVFLRHASRTNSWVEHLKGRGKSIFLMSRAIHVITCTPALTAIARKRNPNVTDISSTIDMEQYQPPVIHTLDREVVIGWSGSHSTSGYLRLIEPALEEVARRVTVRFLIIGDASFRFHNLDCEAVAWSAETEVRDLRRIAVGVYPLPDDPWILGKSGLKALQYMALSIPPVATAAGTNFRVIEHGVSGFLVTTHEEWVDALVRLSKDPALRTRIGNAARSRVLSRFSVAGHRDTYFNVVRRALAPV
jgi:L-malate glycosyltransferase